MLAFEVSVNGERLCIAGTGTSNVVAVGVGWARRDADTIRFNVGGIVADDSNEHFYWKPPSIGIGDEITIRLIDADTGDKPDVRYHPARNPEAPPIPNPAPPAAGTPE
jgi:hypothetical protein